MDEIRHRAAQLAVELLSLQKRMGQEATDIADAATRDLLRELKSSVDSVRHFLRKVVDADAPPEPELPRSLVDEVTAVVDRHTQAGSKAA
jgi:molecular chaperone GrpE (heat shock protein)